MDRLRVVTNEYQYLIQGANHIEPFSPLIPSIISQFLMFSHPKTASLHRPSNQMSQMSHTTPRHELNHPFSSLPELLAENMDFCIPEGLLRYVSKSLVENGFFRENIVLLYERVPEKGLTGH
jgi:hypothetical protein